MENFIINGNRPLSGEICVGGSKNAALPIIFSAISIYGKTRLTNLPNISDVAVAFEILTSLGAKIERKDDTAVIDTRTLTCTSVSERLTEKIRASTYLIGAMLARFGRAEVRKFGGCNFENRPIDMHVYAACALGATNVDGTLYAERLRGGEIRFDKISVGATVNALIMAASADGESKIYGYAKEPHVISLIEFLRSAGAEIEITEEFIRVKGAQLTSADAEIIPDMIEAGTYMILSVITNSELKIKGADLSHLESFIMPLIESGVVLEHHGDTLILSGTPEEPINVITEPYPGFPTDLQPTLAPLLACFCGGAIIETVWHNRFGYLTELSKFGVKYELFDGYVKIERSKIIPTVATVPDLRGGAALLLLALFSDGESVLLKKDLILRGYSDIIKKLRGIGAQISEI